MSTCPTNRTILETSKKFDRTGTVLDDLKTLDDLKANIRRVVEKL